MREIKFRAWHKDKKEMKQLDFINISPAQFAGKWVEKPAKELFASATVQGDLWDLRDIVLMQYTGLKDKNGVEIYEGDIVKDRLTKTHNYIVQFRDGCFWLKPNIKQNVMFMTIPIYDLDSNPEADSDNTMEIICNIYENPELLNVKNNQTTVKQIGK